jgi:hypothetical protein
MRTTLLIGAAALAAVLAACSHTTQISLDPQKAREAYAVGQKLAAQDREQQAEHREEMARFIESTVTRTRDKDRTISLFVKLRNKSAKAIKSLDAGLEVHDASGTRIGLAEITVAQTIAPHASAAFWYPMRYVRFGEDTGTMRLAAGKPKTVRMEVTEIKYADGSDAGYDD